MAHICYQPLDPLGRETAPSTSVKRTYCRWNAAASSNPQGLWVSLEVHLGSMDKSLAQFWFLKPVPGTRNADQQVHGFFVLVVYGIRLETMLLETNQNVHITATCTLFPPRRQELGIQPVVSWPFISRIELYMQPAAMKSQNNSISSFKSCSRDHIELVKGHKHISKISE